MSDNLFCATEVEIGDSVHRTCPNASSMLIFSCNLGNNEHSWSDKLRILILAERLHARDRFEVFWKQSQHGEIQRKSGIPLGVLWPGIVSITSTDW